MKEAQREKLSVVILTFNEEENIQACLESCKWADEIVIVDSGSSDATLDIAAKYTDRIIKLPWQGYAKMWSRAINSARYKWVYTLASDERITRELAKEIQQILQNPQHDGYENPRKNIILGQWNQHIAYPDYSIRLLRKDKFFIRQAPVHERPEVKGSVGRLKEAVLHLVVNDLNTRFNKINSRTRLELLKRGHIKSKYSPLRLLFFPFLKFGYYFLVKRQFLAGSLGIYYAHERLMYEFQKYAKLWEENLRQHNLHSIKSEDAAMKTAKQFPFTLSEDHSQSVMQEISCST